MNNTYNLTSLEMEVLKNLFESADGNGHDFGFTEDHGIDARQARGVISSLVKKGYIEVHEAITNDSGTWHQFTWKGKEPHEVTSLRDLLH
jgi:predicted transcriptional regulator